MKTNRKTQLAAGTAKSDFDALSMELMPRPFGRYGKLWVALLVVISLIGLFFYVKQVRYGLSVTAMRDYSTWGIYVSNFVFFVAISLVGSLIAAILKLSNVKWRTPLTRISEMIAVAAIIFAAIVIIIDMGRPDRFMNVVIKARIQSPITWDVIVISTYLVISILLLYLPMLPDLALMRDRLRKIPSWQQKLYRILALDWRGSPEQKRISNRAIRVLAILIIPVAFGIHTVTSWLFATTLRPGWDSSNFGPYFVSGAFMVGAGAVIAAMFLFRKFYKLERYFTLHLFDKMGRLLVLLSLIYLYFNINEYFVPAYKMKASESAHLQELFYGEYALLFWLVQIGGMVIPIIVLLFKKGRKPLPLFIISILVIVGAWFKRFLIVVPTLSHPYIPMDRVPESWKHYFPTIEEWCITAGTLAGALLIITLLVRFFPIVPIMKTAEARNLLPEDSEKKSQDSSDNPKTQLES
jgi:Ni/Fe-hydrogenase subunit HybB-like protein